MTEGNPTTKQEVLYDKDLVEKYAEVSPDTVKTALGDALKYATGQIIAWKEELETWRREFSWEPLLILSQEERIQPIIKAWEEVLDNAQNGNVFPLKQKILRVGAISYAPDQSPEDIFHWREGDEYAENQIQEGMALINLGASIPTV